MSDTNPVRGLPVFVLAGVCLVGMPVVVGMPVAAAQPSEAEQPSHVQEVVRMLEADLSEEVILEWLGGVPPSAEPLGADELVALKEAGASDTLLTTLLARSRSTGETANAPVPTPPPAPPRVEAAPAEPAPSTEPAADDTAPVTFHLSYLTQIQEYEVAGERAWDLYVYLDGIPLSYMPTAELQNRPETMEFARPVSAGTHTVRVAQERHYREGGRWRHETRAAGPSFRFELAVARPARLQVEFHERTMDYQDPLTFKLTQGETILDTGRLGGDAAAWPALCEDVEASVPSGKKPNRAQRQRLESCVEWTAWWDGERVPPRGEVLDAMAEFEFRPRPKGS